MRSMTRLVLAGLVTMVSASVAGAQQSVRVSEDTVWQLTKDEEQEAREAYAMKCLSVETLVTLFNSTGSIAPAPSKIPSARGNALGLGGMDASQGLVRRAYQAQFDPRAVRASWGSNTREVMWARNESYRGGMPCEPPIVKFPRKR